MLEECLNLVEGKDMPVAVLCGETKEGCKSVDILRARRIYTSCPIVHLP
jgi:hypothetical protein